MKFKIKGDEKEPTIELWLSEEVDEVVLRGKDVNGNILIIMRFAEGGFIRAESADSAKLEGLNTDCDDVIKEIV